MEVNVYKFEIVWREMEKESRFITFLIVWAGGTVVVGIAEKRRGLQVRL